jgi:uncharacterized protein YecE (DUF72 family)
MSSLIRIGIGGWSFAPWRGPFYPPGLRQADELQYASRRLGAIEINATYHSLQTPQSFARWAAETPEDFVFAVKASRFCTNRKVLGEAGEAIDRFLAQGLIELGARLGPILWQFMPTKRFHAEDFTRFLDLLPASLGGRPLRHAVEVRSASFADARFVDLCRQRRVAICLADHPAYPQIDEATADFAYVRLMRLDEAAPYGYPPMFGFFIGAGGEGKVRAPAAAMALIAELRGAPAHLPLDAEPEPARKSSPREAKPKGGAQ